MNREDGPRYQSLHEIALNYHALPQDNVQRRVHDVGELNPVRYSHADCRRDRNAHEKPESKWRKAP